MTQLFLLPGALEKDPAVDTWFATGDGELRRLAKRWFERMRACGPDVRDVLHDGHPTACVGEAAFGYVNAFGAHVNVGFFHGAMLDDPACIQEGAGRRMRHVKVRCGELVDSAALNALIGAAYQDIRSRLGKN